jgi:hypothetical protein
LAKGQLTEAIMPEPANPPSDKGGDYASGWWGEEQAKQGVDVPGPYGRKPEVSPKAPDLKKTSKAPK